MSGDPPLDLKRRLRREVRAELSRLTPAERAGASARVCGLALDQPLWTRSRCILFYAALPDELDLTPLLQAALAQGKSAALPRFIRDRTQYAPHQIDDLARLAPGRFSIAEPLEDCPPVPLKRLDLVFVPGVAFDLQGRRLGRGMGFYDRLLAEVTSPKCGVAFDIQVKEKLPSEQHDVAVDFILTPSGWRSCGNAGHS